MQCHYHSERPVARECRICHHLVCEDCIVKVDEAVVCKTCLAEAVTLRGHDVVLNVAQPDTTRAQPKQPQPPKKDEELLTLLTKKGETLQEHRSGFLTVLFSILPGLGHLYLGMQRRALSLLALFFALFFLSSITPSSMAFPVSVAIPILWFYAQFDALKYRTLFNAGEPYEDVPVIPQLAGIKPSWLGYILLFYGMIAIIDNVIAYSGLDYEVRRFVKDLFSAAVLIGCGYWVLSGRASRALRKDSEDQHA